MLGSYYYVEGDIIFFMFPTNKWHWGVIMQDGTITNINGEEIALDVAAKIMNNRTLVPIRAISEGLGARVEWNGTTKAVLIYMD